MKEKDFIYKIYTKKEIQKISNKINMFGVSKKMTVESFMNTRLFTSLIVFVFTFLFVDYSAILSPIITVIWYFLFNYFLLDRPLKKREKKLDSEAYYYFEVLTLALESGRNLENAIKMACQYIDSEISDEFKETLKQVNFGKSLAESLSLMNQRIPSLTIRNIILNIEQSNMFGNSIIDTMYDQIDFLRDKQILESRFIIGKTQMEIASELGISQAQISRIEKNAINNLKKYIK